LHITQNAQGCLGGIIQILDQRPSEKQELQKNLVWTAKQASTFKNIVSMPDYGKEDPLICIFMHMQIV